MISLKLFLIALAIVSLGYGIKFRFLVKSKGFDPSLITYSNPLFYRGFNSQRAIFLLSVIIFWLTPTVGRFLLSIILVAAFYQLLLLFLFNRQRTQPVIYYLLFIVICTLLLASSRLIVLAVVLAMICIQEVYLALWRTRQTRIYNRWVCREALRINQKYGDIGKSLDAVLWQWVLHVATTEQIARPPIVRLAERIYYRLRHPAVISSGIMQVAAERLLTDRESIRRGAKIVKKVLASMPPEATSAQERLLWISQSYNGSRAYAIYLQSTYPGVVDALDKIRSV